MGDGFQVTGVRGRVSGDNQAGALVVNSYRDLRVWQIGMSLVEQVYRITESFPTREIYGLASQMRRASVSVPSNIAEGHAREHLKEYLHHISMAQGSIAELETQVEIAKRLTYAAEEEAALLVKQCRSLGRQLYAMRNSLRAKAGI